MFCDSEWQYVNQDGELTKQTLFQNNPTAQITFT